MIFCLTDTAVIEPRYSRFYAVSRIYNIIRSCSIHMRHANMRYTYISIIIYTHTHTHTHKVGTYIYYIIIYCVLKHSEDDTTRIINLLTFKFEKLVHAYILIMTIIIILIRTHTRTYIGTKRR